MSVCHFSVWIPFISTLLSLSMWFRKLFIARRMILSVNPFVCLILFLGCSFLPDFSDRHEVVERKRWKSSPSAPTASGKLKLITCAQLPTRNIKFVYVLWKPTIVADSLIFFLYHNIHIFYSVHVLQNCTKIFPPIFQIFPLKLRRQLLLVVIAEINAWPVGKMLLTDESFLLL